MELKPVTRSCALLVILFPFLALSAAAQDLQNSGVSGAGFREPSDADGMFSGCDVSRYRTTPMLSAGQ